ncbi:MAG: hypothetical protein NUV61_00395 [Candidatus Azambacteria bacterium]|nr:hypothetical protein [Candidatus Azambacteria bacterium]
MSIFKFKGKIRGSTISGTVTKASAAPASGVGILGIILPIWILVFIANLLVEEGSPLFVVFAPFFIVVAIVYGIFWLIWTLLGELIWLLIG